MISKEEFVKIINRLRDYNDLQDKIQDLFRDNIDNQEMDFMNAGSICVGHSNRKPSNQTFTKGRPRSYLHNQFRFTTFFTKEGEPCKENRVISHIQAFAIADMEGISKLFRDSFLTVSLLKVAPVLKRDKLTKVFLIS